MPEGLDEGERRAFCLGWRGGYNAGLITMRKRWQRWLAEHPVNTWLGGLVKGPVAGLRGAA